MGTLPAGQAIDADAGLRGWLRAWATDHPRRGFRPGYLLSLRRAEGWNENHKQIQWLRRDEGVGVPQRLSRTLLAPQFDLPMAACRVR
jgi:putative transposase